MLPPQSDFADRRNQVRVALRPGEQLGGDSGLIVLRHHKDLRLLVLDASGHGAPPLRFASWLSRRYFHPRPRGGLIDTGPRARGPSLTPRC